MGKAISRRPGILPGGFDLVWLLGLAFGLGGLAGILWAWPEGPASEEILSGFWNGARGEVPFFSTWLMGRMAQLLVLLLAGTSGLGGLFALAVLGYEGISLGMTLSALVQLYGKAGILGAVIGLIVTILIWVPVLFFMARRSLSFSCCLLRSGEGRAGEALGRMLPPFSVCVFVLVVCGYLQTVFGPYLFEAAERLTGAF